jgi:hypothetical protein
MAYILDISTEWTDEELKQLELVGASKIEGAIMIPEDTTGYLVSLQASLLDLMTPPLCPWCSTLMNEPVYKDGGLVSICPGCGGREVSYRYPPGESEE